MCERFFFNSRNYFDILQRYLSKRFAVIYSEGEGHGRTRGIFDIANEQFKYEIAVARWAGIEIETYKDYDIESQHSLCMSYYLYVKEQNENNKQ